MCWSSGCCSTSMIFKMNLNFWIACNLSSMRWWYLRPWWLQEIAWKRLSINICLMKVKEKSRRFNLTVDRHRPSCQLGNSHLRFFWFYRNLLFIRAYEVFTMQLLDVHPEEMARQLTLIEYNIYKEIKPSECLKQRWTRTDKASVAPNIMALIDRFNKVSSGRIRYANLVLI